MRVRNINIVCFLLCTLFLLNSCAIETYSTKKEEANNTIKAYINDNELNVKPEPSGLVIIPIHKGEGDSPKIGDKVAFHYKGYYMNGEMFDSSYEKSYPIVVELGQGQIIKGMEEALLKMKKYSKSKVIIPFYLAYKDMEFAPVPPYSNLIFELELIDFMKSDNR